MATSKASTKQGDGSATPTRRTTQGTVDGRSTRNSRKVPLSEDVRQKILLEISTGAFAPDDVLNTAALAERYGVSRTPVREALVALERAGVITVLPYRGHMVRTLSLADAQDIYFMREVLETAAAERAAQTIDATSLAQLEELCTSPIDLDVPAQTFDERCYDFHRIIAGASGSARLSGALEQVFSDNQRLHLVSAGLGSSALIIEEHESIVAALRTNDAARAREAMRDHLRSMFDGMLASLRSR
ncbi:GntR family transcriptional regulator [Mycobacterium sp. NPDC050441]